MGLQIALTRTSQANGPWITELSKRGLVGLDVPCLVIDALQENKAAALDALAQCDGMVLTSPRALWALEQIAPGVSLANKPCACVGDKTATCACRSGAKVNLVASDQDAASLAAEWIALTPANSTTFWPRAQAARPELPDIFEAAGRSLTSVAVYDTRPAPSIDLALAEGADAIFFASPSAARALVNAGTNPRDARIIAIGPTTAEALEQLGWPVHGVAQNRSLDGMLEALRHALCAARPSTS